MSDQETPEHHRSALTINRKVLASAARRTTLNLWPLMLLFFAGKVFLNLQAGDAGNLLSGLLSALWVPLGFGALFYISFYFILIAGTKFKMRQAAQNPGPGKPPRGPRREL